jgi:hypothetical protein
MYYVHLPEEGCVKSALARWVSACRLELLQCKLENGGSAASRHLTNARFVVAVRALQV